MAQRTLTQSDSPPVYYALFRKDTMISQDRTSALQDTVYKTYNDAETAYNELIQELPLPLKSKIIILPITDINYNSNIDMRWYVAISESY
jgi:hypothetical protein